VTRYTPTDIVDLAEAAITGNTSAGSSVYPWRIAPFQDDELPAISIYCNDMTGGSRNNIPDLMLSRTDMLQVQFHALDTDEAPAALAASVASEEIIRRIVADLDVRKEFHPQQSISVNSQLDKGSDKYRVISLITIDMRQDFQIEEIRVGDPLTEVYSTVDIDESGTAQDVETISTLTGGTP